MLAKNQHILLYFSYSQPSTNQYGGQETKRRTPHWSVLYIGVLLRRKEHTAGQCRSTDGSEVERNTIATVLKNNINKKSVSGHDVQRRFNEGVRPVSSWLSLFMLSRQWWYKWSGTTDVPPPLTNQLQQTASTRSCATPFPSPCSAPESPLYSGHMVSRVLLSGSLSQVTRC